jgi:hypothetical protein
MRIWKLAVMLALVAAAVPVAVEATGCNPYPVGRCGESDRELVTYCYRTVGGLLVDATDRHVVAAGTSQGAALPDNNAKGVLYVRLTPTETFAADPMESEAPFATVILETNTIRGAQLLPFKCASFVWFAECDSWMGPYNIQPATGSHQPDDIVV